MTDNAQNQDAIEELIVGHFDGRLSEQQETELAAALAASSESKQLFLSYMRMEGRLHSLGRDGFLREPTAEPDAFHRAAADVTPVDQNDNQHSPSMRSRFLAVSTSLAVCAAVVLMITVGLWPSSVSAGSVLQKAQQAAAELVDRTYRLVIFDTNAESDFGGREFTINVRGGGRYVVRPTDGGYVMGSDGTNFWAARQTGPVWVTGSFRSLSPELRQRIPNRPLLSLLTSPDEPFLLDMSSLLSLIEREYELELEDSDDVTEHHVRATLRSGRRSRPPVIDFWADADSGVVLRAQREWQGGRQARFEFVESTTLSDQWYHYSQHAPDRQIQRVNATNTQ